MAGSVGPRAGRIGTGKIEASRTGIAGVPTAEVRGRPAYAPRAGAGQSASARPAPVPRTTPACGRTPHRRTGGDRWPRTGPRPCRGTDRASPCRRRDRMPWDQGTQFVVPRHFLTGERRRGWRHGIGPPGVAPALGVASRVVRRGGSILNRPERVIFPTSSNERPVPWLKPGPIATCPTALPLVVLPTIVLGLRCAVSGCGSVVVSDGS